MAITIERAPDHLDVLLVIDDDSYLLGTDDPNVITPAGQVRNADNRYCSTPIPYPSDNGSPGAHSFPERMRPFPQPEEGDCHVR
jgi:hypothetical protein